MGDGLRYRTLPYLVYPSLPKYTIETHLKRIMTVSQLCTIILDNTMYLQGSNISNANRLNQIEMTNFHELHHAMDVPRQEIPILNFKTATQNALLPIYVYEQQSHSMCWLF